MRNGRRGPPHPAPRLPSASTRMAPLKKNASTECSVTRHRIRRLTMVTSVVAKVVPMANAKYAKSTRSGVAVPGNSRGGVALV